MEERPIIFSGPMVRAILEGRKTQTRRIVRGDHDRIETIEGRPGVFWSCAINDAEDGEEIRCPYGVAGDRLWVKETWRAFAGDDPCIQYRCDRNRAFEGDERCYEAFGGPIGGVEPFWRPSIHMPSWASRITLEVVAVRVERLSAITDEDAVSEGIAPKRHDHNGDLLYEDFGAQSEFDSPARAFISGFRQLNKLAPDADPWVWVVEFRRVGAAP